MSEKIIIETLKGIGLTEKDTEVYIHLAKKGSIPARDITKSFKINKAQVYRSLKNLQNKGIVEATMETPSHFAALPFEKVFELYVSIKKEETQKVEQSREAAMQQWRSITIQQTPQQSDRFMVLEGKSFIYTRLQEMVKKAETEILVATNSTSLLQVDIDNALDKFMETKEVKVKLITEISPQNFEYISELFEQFSKNTQGKHIDLKERFYPRFVLADEKELLFLTSGFENTIENKSDSGLWTNNKSLIQSFKVLFSQLWQDGIDFKDRIEQLKKGHQPTQSIIIKDSDEAEKTLKSIFLSAKKEVLMITTEDDLRLVEIKKDTFAEISNRGVNIMILVPISEKNRKSAKELAKIAKIKHIPTSYFRSMVIDGTHLFQFKTIPTPNTTEMPPDYFESTFYTNDPEYVKGRRDLLLNMWEQGPTEIEKIKRNEARFRSIYENSQDAIIIATPKGEAIIANNSACKMFNMTLEEMKKANWQKNLVYDQKVKEAIEKRTNNSLEKIELTYRRIDGSTFSGETTVSRFTDADGKIKDCIIIRDTTQRKQFEDALKESEDRLQVMFNYINLGISIVDTEGKITQSNPAFQQILGYNKEELKNKTLFDMTHPEDRTMIKQLYQDLNKGKNDTATIEKRNIRKDDKIIRIRLNISVLTRDIEGKPLEYISTIEDVTTQPDTAESKKAKEMLESCKERFQTFLQNSVDLIYRLNLQTGHYEFISPSSKKILGYEPQELSNMSNEEVLATVHPDDLQQLQLDLANLMKEGKAIAEYRIKRKDGTYIWYRNTMSRIYDATGRLLYRDGIGRDLTEIKKAQEMLKTQSSRK